jgi:hypothetical protein
MRVHGGHAVQALAQLGREPRQGRRAYCAPRRRDPDLL